MMDYNEFKEGLAEDLINKGFEVGIQPVTKTNGVIEDALYVMGRKASPLIYLPELYEQYEHGADYYEMLSYVSEYMAGYERDSHFRAVRSLPLDDVMRSTQKPIYSMLISRHENEELLKTLPHRDFLDMAQIYYVDLSEFGVQGTAKITNSMAEEFNLTEEELNKISGTNMRFAAKCYDLGDMVLSFGNTDLLTDFLSTGSIPESAGMFVLTNEGTHFGSGLLTQKDLLDRIAEMLGENMYVIPSSIHELILVRADSVPDPEILKGMVHDVNESTVDEKERLTGSVYYYDRNERSLSIACAEYAQDRNLKEFASPDLGREADIERIELDPTDRDRHAAPRRDPAEEYPAFTDQKDQEIGYCQPKRDKGYEQ